MTAERNSDRSNSSRAAWGARLKWFAAEFVVVVAGIIVALALQAWWESRGNRTKERVYVEQLRQDLLETNRIIAQADSTYGPAVVASAKVLRVFHTQNAPRSDSLAAWMLQALRFDEVQPVTATAEALVSTGDLRLFGDPGFRSAVTRYLESNRHAALAQHSYAEVLRAGYLQFRGEVDLVEAYALTLTPAKMDSLSRSSSQSYLPTNPWRRRFPLIVERFLADRTAYNGMAAIYTGNLGLARERRVMRASADTLTQKVDSIRSRLSS